MPVLTRAVSELTNHIFKPVVDQLSHRILESLEYSDVVGDQIYVNADWSTHSITSDHNDNANVGQTRFSVEVNLQMNPTSQKWDMYTFHHTTAYGINSRIDYNAPVYVDIPNNVKMLEIVSPVTIVLNCELVLPSSELAFQTPQQIFNAHENGAVINFSDLFFDYPVPKPIVSVLIQIWKMDRVSGKEAGVSFIEYIKKRSNNGWNVTKHRDLDEYEIVIPVYDLKALCVLEYSEDRPQGVMEDKLPVAWSIPFVFTVQFNLPTLNILRYPCVINNQLLPSTCIPIEKVSRFNAMPEYHHGIQDEFYDKRTKHRPGAPYYRVPWYDDWIIPTANYTKAKHIPYLVLGLLVEEDTPYNVINISEDFDPDFSITNLAKEFMYQEGPEATSIYVPYHVTLFKDYKELVPDKDFTFTRDLELVFDSSDKVSRYRMILTVATDSAYIDPKWYPLLFKYFAYLTGPLKIELANRVINGDLRKGLDSFIRKLIKDQNYVLYMEYYRKHLLDLMIDEAGYICDKNGKRIVHISEYDPIPYVSNPITLAIMDEQIYKNIDNYGAGSYWFNSEPDNPGNWKYNYDDPNGEQTGVLPNDPDGEQSGVGSNNPNKIKGMPNKGNIGAIPTPYKDRGVTANAYNTDARIFGTVIIPRKAGES